MGSDHRDSPASSAASPPPRRHRWLRALWWGVLSLAALVLLSVGALWYSLGHERGSAWLLDRVPGLQVINSHGSVLGDFGADALVWRFGEGGELRLTRVAWQGFRVTRSVAQGTWLRLTFDGLQAQQASLQMPQPTQDNRTPPPQQLTLPVELIVKSLRIDELNAGALGTEPLRGLQASVHLGDDQGRQHRIDQLAVARGPLLLQGHARVGALAPMNADIEARLQQSAVAGWPAWHGDLQLRGPLARAALTGRVQVASTPAQALSFDAVVQPFAEWPLAQLNAQASALDVSALLAGGPQTALTGHVAVRAADAEQPLDATAQLRNEAPGPWNAGRLPVRQLQLTVAADPRDRTQVQLKAMEAELGTGQQAAGKLTADGRWSSDKGWSLNARLLGVRPDRLDTRAPEVALQGSVGAQGQAIRAASAEQAGQHASPSPPAPSAAHQPASGASFPASPAQPASPQDITLQAQLQGDPLRRGQPPIALTLQAALHSTAEGAMTVQIDHLQAKAGPSDATLQGQATRGGSTEPWRARGRLALDGFDLGPWWPSAAGGPRSPLASRLTGQGRFDLTLPAAAPPADAFARLAGLRGEADVTIAPSTLAGVALQGQLQAKGDGRALQSTLQADVAGNRLQANGRLAHDAAADHWQASIDAPALQRLRPLLAAFGPSTSTPVSAAGALRGKLTADGRWPDVRTQGQALAQGVVWPGLGLREGHAQWHLGTTRQAPLDLQLTLADLVLPGSDRARRVQSLQLRTSGRAESHRVALQADLAAAPPKPAAGASGTASGPQTHAELDAEGSMLRQGDRLAGWRGRIRQVALAQPGQATPLLQAADVGLDVRTALPQAPAQLQLRPGQAQLLGALLRWSQVDWRGAQGQAPSQLQADVTLAPTRVAELLARLQPQSGWRGDLEVSGRLKVRTAPVLHLDVLLQRQRGDLVLQQGSTHRALGLGALRVAAQADGTAWHAEADVEGKAIGRGTARLAARTTPGQPWPGTATPLQGTVNLRVADLGVYEPWLPVGWRVDGSLSADARIAGTLGAPQFSGGVQGDRLAVSNFFEGVRVRDGELRATLAGERLRIERFTARAGEGQLRLEGGATLGAQPSALVTATAERFRALGRVDRRLDLSGQAQLRLDGQRLAVLGRLTVDDGLVDLGRKEAPELSKDVVVVDAPFPGSAQPAPRPAAAGTPSSGRSMALDVHVDLGSRLRLRGKGVNTLLAGDVRVTAPAGQLALEGSVHTVQGTYAAYGENLRIDRGVISFYGPVANPRLDIAATRADLRDVEVGVAITGTAQSPQVRLVSNPEMSELDKLSWLTMGRPSEGLAADQSALLQRAALALLAGQRGSSGEGIAKRLGLDTLSVKRGQSGGLSDAVVSLGKQVSERFYVGYQQSLDAAGSNLELIYKIARRLTVRVQTGEATAVDVIWTWLWG